MRQLCKLNIFTSLLLLMLSSFAHANFDCQQLIGSWSNELYDTNRNKERRSIETISKEGTFWIKFVYSDENDITEQEEHGRWECKGDILTITYNKRQGRAADAVVSYKILELKKTTYTLKTIGNGVIYKYFKVIN